MLYSRCSLQARTLTITMNQTQRSTPKGETLGVNLLRREEVNHNANPKKA
jgi:hypothetical protein